MEEVNEKTQTVRHPTLSVLPRMAVWGGGFRLRLMEN